MKLKTYRSLTLFVRRLTAFASRVFCAAQKFDGIEIDEALVCDSVSWLLENQRQDGAFPEVKDIIHKSMMVIYSLSLKLLILPQIFTLQLCDYPNALYARKWRCILGRSTCRFQI